MEEPYYEHIEVMSELGIKESQLPKEIKQYCSEFNRKKRFAKDPELISEIQNFSALIADEIKDWHETAKSDESEGEEEEKSGGNVKERKANIEAYMDSQEDEDGDDGEGDDESKPPKVEKQESNDTSSDNDNNGGWGLNLNW